MKKCHRDDCKRLIRIELSEYDKDGRRKWIEVKGCPFRQGKITSRHNYLIRLYFDLKNHGLTYKGLPMSEQTYLYVRAMDILGEQYTQMQIDSMPKPKG